MSSYGVEGRVANRLAPRAVDQWPAVSNDILKDLEFVCCPANLVHEGFRSDTNDVVLLPDPRSQVGSSAQYRSFLSVLCATTARTQSRRGPERVPGARSCGGEAPSPGRARLRTFRPIVHLMLCSAGIFGKVTLGLALMGPASGESGTRRGRSGRTKERHCEAVQCDGPVVRQGPGKARRSAR